MNLMTILRCFFLLFLMGFSTTVAVAQDEGNSDEEQPVLPARKSKLLTGFYIGAYFANKYTASAYNGYGFDLATQRNSFINSLMYQKIKNEYGGGYGQYDQIAEALGVDQKQWDFNESDMPVNMRYTPGIMFGFNFKVPVKNNSAIILNVNGSKLSIEGNFTISTFKPQNPNPAINSNIQTFTIRGTEQRVLFQLGFQQVFGKTQKANFFAEAGFTGTLAKYNSNTIYINYLVIDLNYYTNSAIYPSLPSRKPVGFGIGAFGSLGANFEMNQKITLQLLYMLTQEKVNIGTNPTLKLQNGLGLRVYYKL